MKRMWNYFASILVMGLFAGCSNDTLTGDDPDGELNGSKDAVYIGTSVIEAVGITYAAKHIIGRDRPFVKYPDKIHAYGAPDADSPSFPSGHTAAAFSLATSLSITYPKWYVIAPSAVWACGVGFARMNQGVHYPSDVVTGAAIGVGCAFANIYVNRWLNKVLFGRQIK